MSAFSPVATLEGFRLTLADVVKDAACDAAAVGTHTVAGADSVLVVAIRLLPAVADGEALVVFCRLTSVSVLAFAIAGTAQVRTLKRANLLLGRAIDAGRHVILALFYR